MLLKRSILVILVAWLLFIGVNSALEDPTSFGRGEPGPTRSTEKAAVEKLLKDYVVAMEKAYEAGSPNQVMKMPVIDAYQQEIITDILFQAMRKRTMKLTLNKMDIRNVEFFGPAAAQVQVREEWNFTYTYKKGADGPKGGKSVISGVYSLQKTAEGWKISSFMINEEGRKRVAG